MRRYMDHSCKYMEIYREHVWKYDTCKNTYGNIKKYLEYVWKYTETLHAYSIHLSICIYISHMFHYTSIHIPCISSLNVHTYSLCFFIFSSIFSICLYITIRILYYISIPILCMS